MNTFKWKAIKDRKGVSCQEADVSDMHMFRTLAYQGESFRVTIRKYRKNYFLAFQYDEEPDYLYPPYEYPADNLDPIQGISIVLIFLWRKVSHAEFDANPQEYLIAMAQYIKDNKMDIQQKFRELTYGG